jgi:TonB family protein
VLFTVSLLIPIFGRSVIVTAQQPSLAELEAQVQKQYDAILYQFANGPAKMVFPLDARDRVRVWQDELASRFAQAGATIDEILKLNPPQEEMWRERRQTMTLYSQPVSPPQSRTVFGSSEVKPRARLLESPAAIYPEEARAVGAAGEVRLSLVLAADGTVKYVFPMKSLKYGLTESAMDAARQIKFEPAIRDGQPVSQLVALAYEFKKDKAKSRRPYFPLYAFYF